MIYLISDLAFLSTFGRKVMTELSLPEKVRMLHIANNVKEEFDKIIQDLANSGWTIAKTWQKYGSYFADLVRDK